MSTSVSIPRYTQGCDEFTVEAWTQGEWRAVGSVWARCLAAARCLARLDFGRKYCRVRVLPF